MKQKCYLAGQISGLEISDYTALFSIAVQEVVSLGYIAVSPLNLPHNHGKGWHEYMKEDLKALLDCDFVYAMNNWHKSKGATVEVNLAKRLLIPIIYQQDETAYIELNPETLILRSGANQRLINLVQSYFYNTTKLGFRDYTLQFISENVSENELQNFRGFGLKTIEELKELLLKAGLELKK